MRLSWLSSRLRVLLPVAVTFVASMSSLPSNAAMVSERAIFSRELKDLSVILSLTGGRILANSSQDLRLLFAIAA